MGKQIKKTPAQVIGFDTDSKIKSLGPLKPIDDSGTAIGFDDPSTTPTPVEGITPSKQYTEGYIVGSSLKDRIAENQNGWDQFANFLGQTGTEALAGTVEAGSYLLDFQQHFDKLKGDEQEYKNWLGDAMKEVKKSVNEDILPVYLSEQNEGFEPSSVEWWAHNGGQGLGSTLSLLIPGIAVAKLGKAAGLGKLGQTISATIASRYAESTMEANQVYEESYNKLKDQGLSDFDAKTKAGDAASRTWNTNWVFALQDLAQFSAITKGFGSLAKGRKGLGIGELVKQMASEGAEEAGQYVVSQEATKAALDTNVDYFGEGFTKRLSDYINDDEFKTSTLLGAIGGGVFQAAGTVADKLTDVEQGTYIQRAKDKISSLVKRGIQKERANYVDDKATSQKVTDVDFTEQLVDKYNKGKLVDYKAELQELEKQQGLPPEARNTIHSYIDDVDFVSTEEAKLKNSDIPAELHKSVILTKLEQKQLARVSKQTVDEITQLETDLIKNDELPVQLQEIKKIQTSLEGYRRLTATQPQFAPKVAELQQQFDTQRKVSEIAFPDLDKRLVTSQDETLFQKAFQLIATQEKQKALKDDLARLASPQGIVQYRQEQLNKRQLAETKAVLESNKPIDPEMLRTRLEHTTDPGAIELIQQKLEDIAGQQVEQNNKDIEDLIDPQPAEPSPEVFPDQLSEGPVEAPPIEEVPEEPVPSLGSAITNEMAAKWGLSTKQTEDLIDQLDIETKPPTQEPIAHQKDKDAKALEEVNERLVVSAWLKEVNEDGSKTVYTNNITGEKTTADKIFATDEHGNLLANTPKVAVGSQVELVVENDFPFTLTPGFKPTGVDNNVVNVYLLDDKGQRIGNKPIKQLPSADNPRLSSSEAKLNRQIRSKLPMYTRITGKNVGSIRNVSTLNSLEVLGSDYVHTNNGWELQPLPFNPVLGQVDQNGNIITHHVAAMKGMTKDFDNRLSNINFVPRSNELSKIAGKTVTFRTSPDGSLRLVALEARKLNDKEIGWVINNMTNLINTKQYDKLAEVIFIPRHGVGVYSTKNNTKIPDLHKLKRNRLHIVNVNSETSHILLPAISNGRSLWIALDTKKEVDNLLNGRPVHTTVYSLEKGVPLKTKHVVQPDKQAGLLKTFKDKIADQFKNVLTENLNSEIQYTDPVTQEVHPTFYDYLIATDTLQTNLPGSKTLGYGDDSSYSFNQSAIYLDPNPDRSKITIDNEIVTELFPPLPNIEPPIEANTPQELSDKDVLEELFGPKLKPATEGSHTFRLITDKELQWFKDNVGEEFLSIAKNVDRFIAANGREAFGQYYNAIVTIADYAPEGTLYHEALHFFLDPTNQLISERQRNKILSKYTEEQLANEFEKYKISSGTYKVPNNDTKNFFQKILQLIRNLIGLRSPIERLFNELDSIHISKEKKEQIKNGLSDQGPKFKLLPGFANAKQQLEAVQAFTTEVVELAKIASRQEDIDITDIFKKKDNIDKFFEVVKNNLGTDFLQIQNIDRSKRTVEDQGRYLTYLSMGIGTSTAENEQIFIGQFENSTSTAGFPVEGFKTKVLKDLARYGFTVQLTDKTDYNEQDDVPTDNGSTNELTVELKEQDEAERVYDIDHTQLNPSRSISQRVRLFLSTIPEPSGVKNIFGQTKKIDFRRVDSGLTLKLANSINPLTRLEELSKNDPLCKAVLDALIDEKNKGNLTLYNEFLTKYNRDSYYKDSIVLGYDEIDVPREEQGPTGQKTRREYFTKLMNTDQGSADKTLFNKWREEAVRKQVINTDGTVIQRKADKVSSEFEAFKTRYFTAKQKKANLPYNDVKDTFISLTKEFGVIIPEQVWKELDTEKEKYTQLQNMFFGVRSRTLEDLINNYKLGKDPYEGSNLLSDLATTSAVYVETNNSGAYLNEAGDQEFPINTPSYLTEFFNKVKQTPKDIVNFFRQDDFYTNNSFLDAIASESNRIDLRFTSAIRENDNDAKSFEDRTEIDSIIMRFASYYNNGSNDAKIFVGTPSDKTKQPTVSLPKHKADRAKDFINTVLHNTMKSEIVRIQRINSYTERKGEPIPLDIKNLKNATIFKYIPTLNTIPNLAANISKGEIGPMEYKQVQDKADKIINDFINEEYNLFTDYLEENDIITMSKDKEGNLVIDKKSRIPEGILQGKEPETFLKEFFYNDFAWRLEVSKVLQGDLALYSSADDYFKRQYQQVTPGYKGYSDIPTKLTRAVYAKQIKKNTDEYIKELSALSSPEVANKYKEVNKTDAQSLITIDSYRTLSKALGQWTKDHETIYNLAWSKGLTARKAIQDEFNSGKISQEESDKLRSVASEVLIQPLKPFQFNDRQITLPDGKIMLIKEQFKDSITPITPELAAVHSGYKDLLNYMSIHKVDIMSAEDTLKIGGYGTIQDFAAPLEDWQKREVDLESFRFPQLLPDKKKEEVSGTQLHKLILSNINDDTEYTIGRAKKTGKEVKDIWNELWEQKIQTSSKEFATSLGLDESFLLSEDPKKRRDQLFKLQLVLKQELGSRDLNENYSDVLDLVRKHTDEVDFTLPLSFPAFGQRFQSLISNLFKKNILRQKNAGYSAVNLADFGIGYSDELKFITGSKGEIIEAEIGLPIDYLKEIGLKYGEHILPNGNIIWDKLSNAQQESLQFILYRIPTSNKSSMLPVRVAKITPPQLNNVVIIPGELTIQQGLDFDVDKSQLLKRVLTSEGKIDTESIDTKLFNLYWAILTNPAHSKELLTPLANPIMEAKLEEYKQKGIIDFGAQASVVSLVSDVKAEIRNKDGKAEIGIASRYNTGHTVLQTITDYLNAAAEIGIESGSSYKYNTLGRQEDSSGKLISENHAESQQAALDAAKNPLLAYFNVVKGTMATFHTMIDFGVPLPVVIDFFMQPVIKEWTKFYKQEGQRENKATEKLFTNFPDVKAQFLANENKRSLIKPSNLAENLTNKVSQDPEHDAIVLAEFLKIFDLSNQLTKVNNVISIDTFQDATGIEALESMSQQVADVTNPEASVYIDSRIFDPNVTPKEGKRLAAFYKHGILDPLKFAGQFYPSANLPYKLVKDYYARSIGQLGLTDKVVIKKLNQFIDYYQLQGNSKLSKTLLEVHPFKGTAQVDYRTRWSYFAPEFSIWKHINNMIGKFPALQNNELIRNLESQKERKEQVQLIGIRNTDSITNKTDITNAWWDLLNAKSPEVRALGHDLVRYAIFTSGFMYNTKSFADLVPVQFWVQSGLGEVWETLPVDSIDRDSAVVNFIRHNFRVLDRFPEIYGRFTKSGFQSDAIKSAKTTGEHLTEFVISERYARRSNLIPNFIKVGERLYESNPSDPTHFKEVQPLGEKYFIEVSADREVSVHPKNKQEQGSPNPWRKNENITTTFPLTGNVSGEENPYITKYLPEDKNNPKTVIEKLLANETNTVAKRTLEVLLANVDKIGANVIKEELANAYGKFDITDTGTGIQTTIKINPKANVSSESEVRHIILHELVHAYSVAVIQNPVGEQQISFARNLNRLRVDSYVKLHDKLPAFSEVPYGLKNDYEFITELASNPKFRAELRDKGFWSRVLRLFRKLFGFTEKDEFDKTLDEFYSVVDKAENLQKIEPSQFKLEQVKAQFGKKKLTPLEQTRASINSRIRRLQAQGKPGEAKELLTWQKRLQSLETGEQVIGYCLLVGEEMEKLKNVYRTLEKDPSKINPAILQPIQEQLTSYKLLNSFNRQINRNPKEFIPEGADIDVFKTTLANLITDVDRMSESVHHLAVLRWAHIVKSNSTDPNLSLEKIIEDLEVADRDITFISRLEDVGKELRDKSVATLHKLISDINSESWRKTQDELYNTEPIKKTAEVEVLVPNKNGKGFHYDKRILKYTTVGKFKALNDFEKWKGKTTGTFADKFAEVIDQDSLGENSNGVQFISPWSKEGQEILKIKDGSPRYPLKQFYETFVLDYLKSQENIPARSMRPGLRIPTIQRSAIESILTEKGLDKLSVLKEQTLNTIRRRYDEADYYAVDENGNRQEYIPTRFIAKQDGRDGRLSTREVSLDIATTLTVFANEMYTRTGMEKIVADLELGKSVLSNRKVMVNTKIKDLPGIAGLLTSEREGTVLASGEFETIEGNRSEAYKAFEAGLRQHVYGQLKKEEGAFEVGENKYSVSKFVDAFLKYSGFNILFGNIAIPLTNALVGKLTIFKEAVGGNIVNWKDVAAGEKLYKEAALAALSDIGKREKKTKFGRVFAYFNPFEHERIHGLGTDTNYARVIFDKIITTGGSTAEYYLASTAMGSVMNRFKAKNKDGETSIYNALEVSDTGKVQLAPGYTYKGKKDISQEDITEIKDYILRFYQNVYGVSNKLDKPASNEYVVGRLINFMRGWLMPGINTRWRTKFYDERLKQDQEGHYLSAVVAFNNIFTSGNGFLQNAVDTLRILTWYGVSKPELLLHPNELDLSKEEKDSLINLRKANIRKTLFELYLIAGLSILLGVGWGDEDKDSYLKYMIARTRRELVTFMSPSTAWDVLKSPTVALNTIDGFSRIIYDTQNSLGSAVLGGTWLGDKFGYGEEQPIYERGPGKGQNKLWFDIKRQTGFNSLTQFEDLSTKTRIAREGRRN